MRPVNKVRVSPLPFPAGDGHPQAWLHPASFQKGFDLFSSQKFSGIQVLATGAPIIQPSIPGLQASHSVGWIANCSGDVDRVLKSETVTSLQGELRYRVDCQLSIRYEQVSLGLYNNQPSRRSISPDSLGITRRVPVTNR